MAKDSLQRSLPPMEVQRLEGHGETPVQKVDYAEIPLQMAKAQIGSALRTTIRVTGASLKEFGDPSQVNRVCDGDIPSVLARAWARPNTRKELIKALADASGQFTVSTQINEKVS